MPKQQDLKKVLVIGSGPIVIGQAAEFDYAGTQACLALKEEGIEVILINNNPATVMTDESCADRVYFEPLTIESVEAIIQKEQPDGILATLGGQTGLNLAMELHDHGILKKYDVHLLGTPIESIKKGEDREEFRALMLELNEPVPESDIVTTKEAALKFAEQVGYPIIVRPAYTLGGAGGGIASNENELNHIIKAGLSLSPISQCLIEKSIAGFKEIEYEVMRDSNDTCITICNMENIDPVGIHTGDSIVVAPSQTLTDVEYQMLRTCSVKIIRALGIVGGCNIQFALDPNSKQYYLIEVNPRVSRSSALASKATGYPIARMAAKVSIGYNLHELINPVTGHTYASFEPALDYVVVKFPRWPFDKFVHAERKLGTQMKATGEVMAIERNLEAGIQKAVRSLELKTDGLSLPAITNKTTEQLWDLVKNADDRRFFVLLELMRRGATRTELHETTGITEFFLQSFERLIALEKEIKATSIEEVTQDFLSLCKKSGFSDEWLARAWGIEESNLREKRKSLEIVPSYKMVDTCAGEFTASTAYFYSSWSGEHDTIPQSGKKKILLLGSGPIRIGQGIEFDYCSVQGIQSLHRLGYEAIMMNNNPETVSTDYATADRLYFEPLTVEDVLNVIDLEQVEGVIVQLGGQTAISLVEGLEKAGVKLYGTNQDTIDQLEDRGRFYSFMKQVEVPHIPGVTAENEQDALLKATEIGYPVLIRPSYVIGGQGMVLFQSESEFVSYLEDKEQSISYPILIDAYYPGIELEVDALTDGRAVCIAGMFEHVERAGVHSGDSIAVTPPYTISKKVKELVYSYTEKIAKGMDFKGIFNIQFVLFENQLYVIEINPRASRTVPILSKISNLSLIDYTVQLLLGSTLKELKLTTIILPEPNFYTVKAPVFSYQKLAGLDPILEAEMKSTGELMTMGANLDEAFLKAFVWSQQSKPKFFTEKTGSIYVDVDQDHLASFEPFAKQLEELGFQLESNNFDKWIEDDKAIALISLPKLGTKNGTEKRQEALRQRCSVISELSTLQVMLKALTVQDVKYQAIQDWWTKEKEFIN
ncbi:carbamoyl phosphate synthase large subunit [Halalkalibacter akibai]|uniref:Carbamoyl phosphate synthase large chain n=1 Tax=Halalkalibacter akibai (strain ATCC 43226 / DSM 21942 / CIP 109018 / JCM 9157 / 1139) TaxID=1236973 RepID=W4QVU5_HALA3|nr:carbamoyl phosphate synthase large subunit [Halalkalibacter akibai]GAE35419.1 carbamoyl-phosphate synthase large chain [Halalkalibacter akibai JCM 9157]